MRVVAATVLVGGCLGLSGCSAPTPLCDQASQVADRGRLSRATELFARARLGGEGECADKGLAGSAERYTQAHVNLARAREAEAAHDIEGALAAYRSALEFDSENTAAKEALARLQQPIPEFTAPEPEPAVPATPPPAPTPVGGPGVALSVVSNVLLVVLLGLLGWWFWRHRKETAERAATQRRAQEESAEVIKILHHVKARLAILPDEQTQTQALRQELTRVQHEIGAMTKRLRGDLERGLAHDVESTTQLRRHLDELFDFIGDLRRDLGAPITVRYGATGPAEA